MIAIKTLNLTKRYKNLVAVDRLNLEIKQGELFSLLGVNGAGKTTTVKMLCGLLKITEGDAHLNGKSITDNLQEVKKIIAVSPQETAVAPNLTVRENLALMCGIYGFDKVKTTDKINELSKKLSLNEIMCKKASKLSGGQMRRVSIALALISEPQILFLDEPTVALDVLSRSDLWDTIRALKGKVTIVLTTHYMQEAEELSDRIGIMKNGRLLCVGTPNELKRQSGTDSVEKAFINIVKGALE